MRRIGFSRACSSIACAINPGVRDHENAVETRLFHSQIGEDRADGAIHVHGGSDFFAAPLARRVD